jgi:hypothetical protein
MRRNAGINLPLLSRAFVGFEAVNTSATSQTLSWVMEIDRAAGLLVLQMRSGLTLDQLLRHDQFRAAFGGAAYFEFIHERSHQENSPARSLQQVFFR